MPKRKYCHIKTVEPQMVAMQEAGKTRQKIADCLGLEEEQIISWLKRYIWNSQSKMLRG